VRRDQIVRATGASGTIAIALLLAASIGAVKPGEEILVGNGRRFGVLDVLPFQEEDELTFVGLLQVEAA
jgi:hypothetical protein